MGKGSKRGNSARTSGRKKTTSRFDLSNATLLVRLSIVGVVMVSVLAIVLIVTSYGNKGSDVPKDDINWAAQWAVEDSKNYEGIYVHGGNYETFSRLDGIMKEYFNKYRERDLYSMYNEYYANHALSVYGYKYSYEDYSSELDLMAEKYHLYQSDEKYVNFSYKSVTYQDYTNYYLITFYLQFTYKDSNGEIVSTPVMEHIYTIIPYQREDGEIYYKLLDFNISDIGVVADRFEKIEKN